MLLARAGGMVALVRGLAYDLPRIERGFRQMPGDAKDQEERISNVRAVFETMRRAGVDKLPKFRMKPFWKFW